MNEKEIMRRAEDFCEEHGVTEYPVKIVELCGKYGLDVYEEYMPEGVSGLIVYQDENFSKFPTGKLIVANLRDSAKRRRFTIAHELAHFVLHRKDDEALYAHRDAGQNSPAEREANIFASCVLMPASLVRGAIDDLNTSLWGGATDSEKIYHVANEFAVSADAARVRLWKLGLIR